MSGVFWLKDRSNESFFDDRREHGLSARGSHASSLIALVLISICLCSCGSHNNRAGHEGLRVDGDPRSRPVSSSTTSASLSTVPTNRWTDSSILDSYPSGDNELRGISCPTATMCVAVGFARPVPESEATETIAPSPMSTDEPLVESYNGSSWQLLSGPVVNGDLFAVSCVSPSFCVAVGAQGADTSAPLIEMFDGQKWSLATSPSLENGISDEELFGVSCVSDTACFAVGGTLQYGSGAAGRTEKGETLVERFDGTSWSVMSSPNVEPNDLLSGVSCATSTECAAVGNLVGYSVGPQTPFVLVLSSETWAIAPLATALPASDVLSSVACNQDNNCVAVGYQPTGPGTTSLVIDIASGSATLIGSPNTPLQVSELLNISCWSKQSCVAVGKTGSPLGNKTIPDQVLIEQLFQKKWTIERTDYLSTATPNLLNGISCLSEASCVAIGSGSVGQAFRTFALE